MSIKDREIPYKTVLMLKKKIKSLEEIKDEQEWWEWHANMLGIIERLYTKNSNRYKHFDLSCGQHNSKQFLETIIDEINAMGMPSLSPMPYRQSEAVKIENNIHNKNNNSQTQNIELNIILETIQDELPPVRYREIQEIVKSEEPKESKLTKMAEKLKDTGIDVVASTLAKILGQSMGI